MSLPLGFDWLTGYINLIVEDFLCRLRQPFNPQRYRQYWTLLYETAKNPSFKTFHFSPLPLSLIFSLVQAVSAFTTDLTPTIESLCEEWDVVKVWTVLYARYESANLMDEHLKVIDAYLPVEHTIFLRRAADVDGVTFLSVNTSYS